MRKATTEEIIVKAVVDLFIWSLLFVFFWVCSWSGGQHMKEKIEREAVSHNLGTYRQAANGELYFFWVVNPNDLTTPVIHKTNY
jgi:hypothetical protein